MFYVAVKMQTTDIIDQERCPRRGLVESQQLRQITDVTYWFAKC